MTTTSFRDVEKLSASLDGQLSQVEKKRLEARIRSDPALVAALADLRLARSILHRTPKRSLPRNFTLTPGMAGIKPPVPPLVPAFSWASAVAMLLFVFTLGTNLLGKLSFGASAPMLAAAPMASEGYGIGGGPAATQPPASDNALLTPTPQTLGMTAPEPTTSGETLRVSPPAVPAVKAALEPVNPWPFVWLGLAAVLIAAALLIRLVNIQAFHRKAVGKKIP